MKFTLMTNELVMFMNNIVKNLIKENNGYYALLIIAQLFWAGNAVVASLAHGHIGPFALSFYRWLSVIVILFPFVIRELNTQLTIIVSNIKLIALLSVLGMFLYTSLIYLSLTYTTVINSSIINTTIPALIVFLAWLFYGEAIYLKKIFGVVLSLFGVIIIITHGKPQMFFYIDLNIGDIISFCAAFVWASYSILLKRLPKDLSPLVFLFTASSISLIFLFPAYIIEYHSLGAKFTIDIKTMIFIIYTAVCPAILAFSFWNMGIRKVGSATAGYFMNLLPLFSAILAIVFLGEKMHWYIVFGSVFVFSGIYFSTLKKKSANNRDSQELSRFIKSNELG